MRIESRELIKADFQNEAARYAYVEDFLNVSIAAQIKGLREARKMSQGELAEKIGTKQSGISRLENVNYDSWKVETLRKLARAFNVRLRISFEEFGSLFPDIENFQRNLAPQSFEDDPAFKEPAESSIQKKAVAAQTGTVHQLANVKAGNDLSWIGNSLEAAAKVTVAKTGRMDYLEPSEQRVAVPLTISVSDTVAASDSISLSSSVVSRTQTARTSLALIQGGGGTSNPRTRKSVKRRKAA